MISFVWCYGSSVKSSCWAQVFEHVVPCRWRLGRLGTLREVQLCWKKHMAGAGLKSSQPRPAPCGWTKCIGHHATPPWRYGLSLWNNKQNKLFYIGRDTLSEWQSGDWCRCWWVRSKAVDWRPGRSCPCAMGSFAHLRLLRKQENWLSYVSVLDIELFLRFVSLSYVIIPLTIGFEKSTLLALSLWFHTAPFLQRWRATNRLSSSHLLI